MRASSSTRSPLRSASIIGGCGLAALALSYHFTGLHLEVQRWDAASLQRAVAGEAIVPMQYRVLIPWVVSGLRRVLGSSWSFRDYELAIGVVSGLGLWLGVAALQRQTTRDPWASACLWALLAFPLLPFHYIFPRANYYYCYDVASVAFYAILLAAMARRSWIAYYPLFVLATFNRETTAFLVPIFLLTSRPKSARQLFGMLGHAAAQTLIWCAIKLWLRDLYVDNVNPSYSGEWFRTEVERNVRDLLNDPETILRHVTAVFGYLWVPVLFGYRHLENAFLRRALWIVPPWFGAMFYVGLFEEVRIFAEMIPLVLVSFIHIVRATSASARAA